MKLKDKLQVKHEILDALASEGRPELKKAAYVAYNNIIEFPQPCAFTLKALKRIIKSVENNQELWLKKDNIMVGMNIEIPMPKELIGKVGKGTKCSKIKTRKEKYYK